MFVRNAKQAQTIHPTLKAAIAALLPDSGPVVLHNEKTLLEALRKDPVWLAAKLGEDQVTAALKELIAEGKLQEVNPVASASLVAEVPKVG